MRFVTLKIVSNTHARWYSDLFHIPLCCEGVFLLAMNSSSKSSSNMLMLQTDFRGDSGWQGMRRVNAPRNQWERHDLQHLPRLSGIGVRIGHPADGRDAGALVTLVVPGRPCWVCAKIKWKVPGQPQAICLWYTCCWLWLYSLCKNSCFLKWNESKTSGARRGCNWERT